MTTKEVAETLGTTPNVITENGKKLFPNKEVQRGKVTDRDWGEVNAYGPDTWALWESKFKK